LNYIKDWYSIKPMIEAIKAHDPNMDINNKQITRSILRPGEPLERQETTTIGEMIRSVEWLDGWKPFCDQCKYCYGKKNRIMNLQFKEGREFQLGRNPEPLCGCYGQIKYPISETLETLLGTALTVSGQFQKGLPESMMAYYLLENPVTGESIRYSRMHGIFERTTGIIVPVQTSPNLGDISTDQLFDVLLHYQNTPQTVLGILAPFTLVMAQVLFNILDKGNMLPLHDGSCLGFISYMSCVQHAAAYKANVVVLP
jgi:hypothetical protein